MTGGWGDVRIQANKYARHESRKICRRDGEGVVRPRRFELLTYSFGGCRSIQLSYGRALLA
jgi:hypothetical protein